MIIKSNYLFIINGINKTLKTGKNLENKYESRLTRQNKIVPFAINYELFLGGNYISKRINKLNAVINNRSISSNQKSDTTETEFVNSSFT